MGHCLQKKFTRPGSVSGVAPARKARLAARIGIRALAIGATAVTVLLSACSTTPVVTGSTSSARGPYRLLPWQADEITIYAVGLVGTPYRYGGNTPDSGFDCSGLIGHVYQTRAGVAAPRTVAMLKDWGAPVSGDSVHTGDLVLFLQGDVASHAGIYVGGGRFVHAPSSGGEVRLDSLNSKYWAAQKVAFRRP